MFFPDKVKGNSEARRVLRDGGHYLLAIWDSIERNPMSDLTQQTMVEQFPDNPPMFMKRGPFSYHDPEWIERDLKAAGFGTIDIDTVKLASRSHVPPTRPRGGFVTARRCASSWRNMAPAALDDVFATLSRSAQKFEGPDGFEAPMSAHIVTATK